MLGLHNVESIILDCAHCFVKCHSFGFFQVLMDLTSLIGISGFNLAVVVVFSIFFLLAAFLFCSWCNQDNRNKGRLSFTCFDAQISEELISINMSEHEYSNAHFNDCTTQVECKK